MRLFAEEGTHDKAGAGQQQPVPAEPEGSFQVGACASQTAPLALADCCTWHRASGRSSRRLPPCCHVQLQNDEAEAGDENEEEEEAASVQPTISGAAQGLRGAAKVVGKAIRSVLGGSHAQVGANLAVHTPGLLVGSN